MALRDPWLATPIATPEDLDALAASGMGSLRRGYESGRLTNEANYNLANLANLRATGDPAAAGLRAETDALRRRASVYAPQVGRVEDIRGVGDAGSYVLGQVGQGAASMQDPIAASALVTGAGTALQFAPNPVAKLVGTGLRTVGAPLAAYGLNQRQLTGEGYGDMLEDPSIASQDPTMLRDRANLYGAGAAVLDTAVPGIVGRQLGGGALRSAAKPLMRPGMRAGAELLGEGATETAQEYGKQQVLGDLNPNRDTSGDASALLNSFVGGVAGAGGPVLAGHAAQAAFQGLGRAGERASQAAGTVRELGGQAIDAVQDFKGVRDLRANLRTASQSKNDTSLVDADLIMGNPPEGVADDPVKYKEWAAKTTPQRADRIVQGLEKLAAQGDEAAAAHHQALAAASDSPEAFHGALEAAADHLVDRLKLDELAQQAEAASTKRGGLWGLFGRKQNRQGADWTGDEYEASRHAAMNAFDEAAAAEPGRQRSLRRAQLMGEYLAAQTEPQITRYKGSRVKGDQVSAFMRDIGERIGDLADSWGLTGKQEPAADKKGQQFDNLKLNLASTVRSLSAAYGPDAPRVLGELRKMADPKATPLFDYLDEELATNQSKVGPRQAAKLRDETFDRVLKAVPPEQQTALLQDGIDLRAPGTRSEIMKLVASAADGTMPPAGRRQLERLLGGEAVQALVDAHRPMAESQSAVEQAFAEHKGVLVRDEDGNLTESEHSAMEDPGEGTTAFDQRQGQKSVEARRGAALYALQGLQPRPDRSLSGKPSDPLRFSKTHRPRLFDLRTTAEQDSAAKPEDLAQRKGMIEKYKDALARHLGGDTSWDITERSALEDMAQREGVALQTALGPHARNVVSPSKNEGARKNVDPDNVSERLGVNAPFITKVISRYQQFMRDEADRAANSDKPEAQARQRAFAARALAADTVLKDRLRQSRQGARAKLETTPEQRELILQKAIAYLSNFGVVVAERRTNRDPERISADQVLTMAKQGRALHDAKGDDVKEDKNGLLMFKSALATKDGKPAAMYIKARDLVRFARTALRDQGQNEKAGNANVQYLRDLSTGIAALVDSGHVEGLPLGFAEGKLPDSLPLATTTYGKWAWGKEQRVKEAAARMEAKGPDGPGDARESGQNQERVAGEQAADIFVPDDSPDKKDERVLDEARGHIIESRAQGYQATAAPLTKSKRELNAESDKALAEHAAAKEDAAPAGKTSRLPAGEPDWSGSGRKLNAQAIALHNELKRPGFGAAHNSPIKHEGKFDWRKHLGKGEGAWVYGAGTYLSTADNVHRYYKKAFTAETQGGRFLTYVSGNQDVRAYLYDLAESLRADAVTRPQDVKQAVIDGLREQMREYDEGSSEKEAYADAFFRAKDLMPSDFELGDGKKSPTYEVTVEIAPERIMDWDAPLSDQPASIRLRALKAIKDNELMSKKELTEFMEEENQYEVVGYEESPATLELTGAELYGQLTEKLGSEVKASDYLQSLGILGHRYASAKRNRAEPNYVIYDDSKIRTNFVSFNRQQASGQPATPEQIAEAKAYVEKVLGKQVKVDFKNITGYSGEWIEATNTIEISTTSAAGTLQTVYHEALHAFFSKFIKNDPRAFETLKALAEDQELLARAHALLDGFPAAQADLLASGEERLAYMYQFWAAGLLDLPTKKAGLFEALRRFFRQVLGKITDSERAAAIFQAFHEGKLSGPSTAGKVIAEALNEGTWTTRQLRKMDGVVSLLQNVSPAHSLLMDSDSKTAQDIGRSFWTNPGDERQGDDGEGYINARGRTATKYVNLFADAIKGLSDRDMRDLATHLQGEKDPADIPFKPVATAAAKIYALNQRFFKYMKEERGVDIGSVSARYYPRVWDAGQLLAKQDEFVAMLLAKYDAELQAGVTASGGRMSKEAVAQRIHAKLVSNSVGEHILPSRDDGVLAPFFSSAEVREMKWLKGEDAAPFLSKDLIGTMTGYFHAGARMAEYTARFGQKGELLDSQLQQVSNELLEAAKKRLDKGEFKNLDEAQAWASRRMAGIHKAVGAMEGTLGRDIGSGWRSANAWMMVYQNLRLLPMALFSSVVDPLGLVARGAPMKEAYDAFLRGMKEVGNNWADMVKGEHKERQRDKWDDLARAVGTVDAAIFSNHAANEYASMYMSKKAKRVNDTFFRLNGMEAWNRGMRAGATKSAVMFLERHAKNPGDHSVRWLKELGLTAADLTFDSAGDLVTDKRALMVQKGISASEAERQIEKVHYAISRWVQGAVLTPNAAQRPSWASDPHYSMFFHLKQFSYSFHQTVLKRAVNELNYGNLAPMGAFAWYIPVMIASDITKGLMQGGGTLPAHMQGMNAGDWLLHGAERAGMLGIGNIGVDASHDIWSIGGPAVEQVINAFTDPIGRTVVDALPAHGLYAEALR